MFRVTVELHPGGNAGAGRVIATADIARTRGGALGTYEAKLSEEGVAYELCGELHEYPRYSASIWDLVARSIAVAMSGHEELLPRPPALNVPVHLSDGLAYVRLAEIPEPARHLFTRNIAHSTRPIIPEDPSPHDCAYLWDWRDFLSGAR